jgi:hypothetical protein
MESVKTASQIIRVGRAVLTYNRKAQYDNLSLARYFRQPTSEELRNLQPGDTIWVEVDDLHRDGGVYGFLKVKVARIRDLTIEYGRDLLHVAWFGQLRILDDEPAVAAIIAVDPWVTDIYTDDKWRPPQKVSNN